MGHMMLTELEDQRWFPRALREFQTAFIGMVVCRFHVYRPFITLLRAGAFPPVPMQDLCSGSGEPAVRIFNGTGVFTSLLLSDKFPPRYHEQGAGIHYDPIPLDVMRLRVQEDTCYTMLNAFHHFTDAQKRELVQRFCRSRSHACIVEVLEPTVACFLKVLFTTTVGCLLLMPLVRPFSFARLFFTYAIPVNLLTITYDGLVSVCKSRSYAWYRDQLGNGDPRIRVRRLQHGLVPIIVIDIRPEP
jgi:hypothetical protein